MKLVAIVADNPNAALMQVHEQLGPDAVVVSVRKLPREGISRLWQNGGKLEVTACIPEKSPERGNMHSGERGNFRRAVCPVQNTDRRPLRKTRKLSRTLAQHCVAGSKRACCPSSPIKLEEKILSARTARAAADAGKRMDGGERVCSPATGVRRGR